MSVRLATTAAEVCILNAVLQGLSGRTASDRPRSSPVRAWGMMEGQLSPDELWVKVGRGLDVRDVYHGCEVLSSWR